MSPKTARKGQSKLERGAVVEAALAIADVEGLDAISFRRLAEQFGVTPMALYWHFKDKDELLGSLADRLWEQTAEALDRSLEQLDASEDHGWAQLRVTLDALVSVMREHPAVAELVPLRVMSTGPGLHVTELTLAFLSARGFDSNAASDLARYVLSSAVMLIRTQAGVEIPDQDARLEMQRQKRIALASLPEDLYPHVNACAGYLTDCESEDTYFTRGFDAIIAGVRAQAPGVTVA